MNAPELLQLYKRSSGTKVNKVQKKISFEVWRVLYRICPRRIWGRERKLLQRCIIIDFVPASPFRKHSNLQTACWVWWQLSADFPSPNRQRKPSTYTNHDFNIFTSLLAHSLYWNSRCALISYITLPPPPVGLAPLGQVMHHIGWSHFRWQAVEGGRVSRFSTHLPLTNW